MPSLRIAPISVSSKLDSDREALPFPEGGVFGSNGSLAGNKTVREIERTLDTMQKQLDELNSAVDEVLKFSEYTDADTDGDRTPPPPAAA